MRNKEDKKCKKGSESTIGKIIYGFLLFMPLFAIGSACLISTFNMSGKEEAEITYKYQSNEVTTIEDILVGNSYHFDYKSSNYTFDNWVQTLRLKFFNINGLVSINSNDDEDFDWADEGFNYILELYVSGDDLYLYFPTNDDSAFMMSRLQNSYDNFSIKGDCVVDELEYTEDYIDCFSICENIPIESIETHNLNAENVFYNAVDKVTESPLFSWAENSIIYTTTNATCNALSITTPFIPLLLSYWLIISVMYFLYDIALMLVWMVHRKIHELQESF